MNKLDYDIDLKITENEDIALEMQNYIYQENKKLTPFLYKDVRKYLLDLNIDFTNQEINSINGIDNIYDSKYEKIKKYSDFNFNDASDVLLYIIVSQLIKFISCITDTDMKSYKLDDMLIDMKINIDMNMGMDMGMDIDRIKLSDMNDKNLKCKYICEFILLLLEEMNEDSYIFNDINAYNNIRNELRHDTIDKISKSYFKEDKGDYLSFLMEKAFGKKISDAVDLDEGIGMEQIEYDNQLQSDEMMEFIVDKAKIILKNKLGHNPTDDEIETFKSDYMSKMKEDDFYDEEAINWDSTAMGKDVLDQGAGYGEFSEFDFETGDGFDYSDQMID
jgi:hypothetical protein